MIEVTAILGACGSEVADYFFDPEAEAEVESEVLVERALEEPEVVAFRQSFTMWPLAPHSKQRPWSMRCWRSSGRSLPSFLSLLERVEVFSWGVKLSFENFLVFGRRSNGIVFHPFPIMAINLQGEVLKFSEAFVSRVLREKYTVRIPFNITVSPSPFRCSNLLSLFPYYIQTPISCYLSICFNTLRYVSTYLLNLVVVPLTLSSV